MSDSEKLTPRQSALIAALTTFPYPTITAAAETLGIPRRTATNWLTRDSIRDAIKAETERETTLVRNAIHRRLMSLADSALDAKEKNLDDRSGHVRHEESSWVLERLLGAVPHSIELSGPDGGPIEHALSLADLVRRADAELNASPTDADSGGNPQRP